MQRATKASEIGQFMYSHSPYKFHTNVKLSTYLAISQPKCPDWNWMKTALSNKQRTLILWMAEVRAWDTAVNSHCPIWTMDTVCQVNFACNADLILNTVYHIPSCSLWHGAQVLWCMFLKCINAVGYSITDKCIYLLVLHLELWQLTG